VERDLPERETAKMRPSKDSSRAYLRHSPATGQRPRGPGPGTMK
jgi:hypothetical protein